MLIASIVSAIVIIGAATTASVALTESIQTAHAVDVLLTNVTHQMIQQSQIDQEILTRLSATESAIVWLGERQNALALRQQLTCDPGFSKLCVTPLRWNSSQHSWADIRHRLQGAFSTNLRGQIDQLQLELHQELCDIKRLTEQKVFQTLHDNLQWLNPKNWFDGLNLQVWVMAALVCVFVLILICALRCIWRLFSRDRVRKQQMVGFTGLTTTTDFTNKKGGDVGNCPAWFQKL